MRAAYAPRTACLIKIDSQSKSRLSLVCELLDLDVTLVTSSENVIV